ncbi:kinase-like domain-containing protein, partial [Gigaspora rosea]
IHSNNIIHCDLHSGNILQDDLYNAYIGDLGFATSINKTLDKESGGIYGALPYIAPEILEGQKFTKSSDIYSFGMIMWEISSGNVAYFDYKDEDLILEIAIRDKRPAIIKGTAPCYVNLMKKCWDKVPEKRPSAIEIHETILKWKNSIKTLAEFLKSDKKMEIKPNALNNTENRAIYTSEILKILANSHSNTTLQL